MDHKTIAINESIPLLQLLWLYMRNDSFFDMSAALTLPGLADSTSYACAPPLPSDCFDQGT